MQGGSPLVSKRHGSTSNLHEPSPVRFDDCQSHHSSRHHYNSNGGNRDLSPIAASHSQHKPMVGHNLQHPSLPQCDRVELEEFLRGLKDIVFAEREVESAKIELALKSDFNMVDAFKMLDIRGGGLLT